jgi:hypothetical protein
VVITGIWLFYISFKSMKPQFAEKKSFTALPVAAAAIG